MGKGTTQLILIILQGIRVCCLNASGESPDVSGNPKFFGGQQKDKPEFLDISQRILVLRVLLRIHFNGEKNDNSHLAFLLHHKTQFEYKANHLNQQRSFIISATHGMLEFVTRS